MAARRALRAATGTNPGAPRFADSIEDAIADMQERPVPFSDDGAQLRQLIDAGAEPEPLGFP